MTGWISWWGLWSCPQSRLDSTGSECGRAVWVCYACFAPADSIATCRTDDPLCRWIILLYLTDFLLYKCYLTELCFTTFSFHFRCPTTLTYSILKLHVKKSQKPSCKNEKLTIHPNTLDDVMDVMEILKFYKVSLSSFSSFILHLFIRAEEDFSHLLAVGVPKGLIVAGACSQLGDMSIFFLVQHLLDLMGG